MTTALQYGSKPVGGYDHLPTLPAYRASNNPPLRATATVRRVPVAAPSSSLRQSHGHSTTHVTSHSPSHQQHHHSPTRRVHPPHHQRSDHLILTRRRNEEARLRQEEQIHYYDRTAQQAHFEEDTSDQIKRKKVLDRFQQLKLHEDAKLDARKDRLRDLLERDEDLWRQELAAAEPTKESRVQAMRDRMTELKQKREAERLALVEEKLLQRWRNECDELRAVESRILETEVANARAGQLVEHQEKVALAAQEKRYYDHLWEQDRLRKIEREEKDRTHQRELNEATTATLKEQLYMLQMKAQEEQRLKQEEAALMRQDLELQKLTEERVHQQKLASQRLIRLDLDAFNKSKVQARQREVQDALELDLKVVNAFFRMDEMEKETKSRRKEQLKLEMRMYMDHLKHQQEIERENAKEIDRLYAEESTKLWQARADKWQREQRARDRLMQEVIAGRKEQLEHALNQNRVRLHEAQLEKHALEAEIAQQHHQEELSRAEHLQEARDYKAALVDQVAVSREKRRDAQMLEMELGQAARDEEVRYRELLAREVDRAHNLPRVRAFRQSCRDPATLTVMPLTATVVGSAAAAAARERSPSQR